MDRTGGRARQVGGMSWQTERPSVLMTASAARVTSSSSATRTSGHCSDVEYLVERARIVNDDLRWLTTDRDPERAVTVLPVGDKVPGSPNERGDRTRPRVDTGPHLAEPHGRDDGRPSAAVGWTFGSWPDPGYGYELRIRGRLSRSP